MNLYLIARPDTDDYDVWLGAVVCANTADEARLTHPAGGEWDGKANEHWVSTRQVKVALLGKAKSVLRAGVVFGSYRHP